MKFKIMQLVLEILHQMFKKSSLVQHVTPGFYPFFYFLIALTPGFSFNGHDFLILRNLMYRVSTGQISLNLINF